MNVSRRRYMGGSKDDYIQDGLVFHLDGINKGDDATAWTDLIGGVKFAYNSHSIVNTDNVEMDGRGCIVANGDVTYPWNTSTIEICIDRVSNSSDSAVFFPNKANYIAAILNSNNTKVYTNAGTTSRLCFNVQYSNKSTISFNQAPNIIINGEVASYTTFNDWYSLVEGYASIGGRNIRNPLLPYKGKIYAIRIYNRLLSSAEMIHNHQIDNQRFNLGIL